MLTVKRGSTTPILFFMVSSSNPSLGIGGLTGIAVSRCRVIDSSFAAALGSVSEVSDGWYKFTPAVSDFSAIGDTALHITATGALDADFKVTVVEHLTDEILAQLIEARRVKVTTNLPVGVAYYIELRDFVSDNLIGTLTVNTDLTREWTPA